MQKQPKTQIVQGSPAQIVEGIFKGMITPMYSQMAKVSDHDADEFAFCLAGMRPVPTMNRQMRTKYVAKGTKGWTLNLETVLPLSGSINWSEVEESRISIESPDGSFRETYIDCFPSEIGTSSGVDNNASRSISLFALDHIVE